MPVSELPHTPGCLVCGRDNPHGLHLDLHVDTETGIVTCTYTPDPRHIGFIGIVHGGVLATVLDEAMVWAATWAGRRFCVCGELTVRYRQNALVGQPLRVEAKVASTRARLIETAGTIHDASGQLVTSAWGKYVPIPAERNRAFLDTLVHSPATDLTRQTLEAGTP